MKENPVVDTSYAFALRIVSLYRFLTGDRKEYVLSKQLLRSGTSIGANVNEAQAAQSRADFIGKMSIASKEARETRYWLRLLADSQYIDRTSPRTEQLFREIDSLNKMLTSIVKTSSNKQ